jgi:hypothetical protein
MAVAVPAVAQSDGRRPADEHDNGAAGDARPLRWVDQSRQEFQRLMDTLAQRSAGVMPPAAPRRPARTREEPEWDWAPMPPPTPPSRPAGWEPDEDDRRPPPRARERARYPAWPPHSARCRRAGVPVEGGGWYTVAPGDTLWTIAEAHYGDGGAWRRLVEANRRLLPDPSCIYACQRIYIPYVPRRIRQWPGEARPRPARDDEEPWARYPSPPPPLIEPVSARPRGCTDCGAGSHVGGGNGNGDDRGWR